jgi:hypothetical protein
MSDQLRGGTTIGGYLAWHAGLFKSEAVGALNGLTAAEISSLLGVTSAIQTQINLKFDKTGGDVSGNILTETAGGRVSITPTGWRASERASIRIQTKTNNPAEIDLLNTNSSLSYGWQISSREGLTPNLIFYSNINGTFTQRLLIGSNGDTTLGGKLAVTSSAGTDSNTVYIKDSTGYLKERTIQSGVWTYNYNQNLNTISNVQFGNITAGLNIIYGTPTATGTRNLSIESTAAGTVGRALTISAGSTSADATARNIVGGNLTIQSGQSIGSSSSNISFFTPTPAGSAGTTLNPLGQRLILDSQGVGVSSNGTGADSNTVYIKDANGRLKERSIPAVAWTNTQAVNTNSNVQFASATFTGDVSANGQRIPKITSSSTEPASSVNGDIWIKI